MGVTYKLTDKVVKFIIQQKKANPKIGCRALTQEVSRQFQIQLSKSSISNILKNASLSSPVGRRASAGRRLRQFHIPEEKKKQLLPEVDLPAAPLKAAPPEAQQKFTAKTPEKSQAKKHPKSPPASEMTQAPHRGKAAPRPPKPTVVRIQPSLPKQGQRIDGAGTIFLKAAEWDVADEPLLWKFLKDKTGVKGLSDQAPAWSDVLLLSQFFGVQDPDGLGRYAGQGLWALNGITTPPASADLQRFIQAGGDPEEFKMNLAIELAQIFQPLQVLQITLSDGQNIVIDAQMTSPWKGKCPAALGASMNQVMAAIVRQFLNLSGPVIFCGSGSEENLSPDFFALLAAMDRKGALAVCKIAALDSDGQELAAFDAADDARRIFLTGVWPWQNEYKAFLTSQDILEADVVFVDGIDQEFYYREMMTSLVSGADQPAELMLRTLLLFKSGSSMPFVAVMTNASAEELSSRQVVTAYLNRWPQHQEGFNIFSVKHQTPLAAMILPDFPLSTAYQQALQSPCFRGAHEGLNELMAEASGMTGAIRAVGQLLYQHALQRFSFSTSQLNISDFISNICGIPGSLLVSEEFLIVSLDPGKEPLRPELLVAVNRVNEANIKDFAGHKILIKIL